MNLSICFLSLFEMPNRVVGKIDQIVRKFLWGDEDTKRKVHFVAWSEVLKPKSGREESRFVVQVG